MVPSAYWPSLTLLAAGLFVVRLVRRAPLVPGLARGVDVASLALATGATAALAFHCTAMFFPRTVGVVPGLESPTMIVRTLGIGSKLAYYLPAAALLVGLRHVWWPALIALAIALLAVGYTMYGSGLTAHLTALAAAILLGALVVTGLVTRARGSSPPREAVA